MRLLFALFFGAVLAPAQFLAIRNVTLLDMTSAEPRSHVTVVLKGNRIAAAGTGIRIPAGARIIDGTGKFLIPGLWDMHVHLWDKEPMWNLYIANGVLGIRDMGSEFERTRKWREGLAVQKWTGFQIYTSGSPLQGASAADGKLPIARVTTPEQARRAVDMLDTSGVDFVNVLSSVRSDEYESLAQRARLRRIPFAGHVPDDVPVRTAIDLRQRSMEHLSGILLACSPLEPSLRPQYAAAVAERNTAELARIRQRARETFSPSQAGNLFHRMETYAVAECPTLSALKRRCSAVRGDAARDLRLRYVPAAIRSEWETSGLPGAVSPEQQQELQRDYDFHAGLVRLMAQAGVQLLAGTDTGDPYVLPGFSLHDELELLVAAGLTPFEALQTATIHPARYFEIEQTHGAIAAGKSADLVMLDANPLEDIRNTRRISAVILNGRLIDRAGLDALLKRE